MLHLPLVGGVLLMAAPAVTQVTPHTALSSALGARGSTNRGVQMERVTSKDGTKIAVEKAGSGPAVIVVAGALAQRSLNADKPLVAKLSEHFTVYRYDRRGRGESTDTKPYAVEREIEDLASIINQSGTGAYLYGVSSGAALAMQAAAKLGPEKVRRLALYDPPYGQKKQDFDRQKERVAELIQKGKPGDAAVFFLSDIGTPPEVIEGMKSSPDWETIKKIDFTLAYDYAVLGDGAVPRDIAKAITVPTLVMNGQNSMEFMHATADSIGKIVPHAQRKTLKGQAHQAKAEAVAPVLIEFFNKKD
jgi:pimeloyl-ACP methyl ester carboxylesterase